MKKKFSIKWKASKQPRKQRKYLANAPLHIKRKMLSVNFSKDLRKKHEKRNILLRKGDIVKIMRGKFKKKQGKVTEIKTKKGKIYIENMQVKKQDGSKANIPFRASNLQIIELNMEDKKRFKKINKETPKKVKPQPEKQEKIKTNTEVKNKLKAKTPKEKK
jgi:large subunit ribosomal protein L24